MIIVISLHLLCIDFMNLFQQLKLQIVILILCKVLVGMIFFLFSLNLTY